MSSEAIATAGNSQRLARTFLIDGGTAAVQSACMFRTDVLRSPLGWSLRTAGGSH